jgi:hypothetical protein
VVPYLYKNKDQASIDERDIEDAPSDLDDDIADEYDTLARVGTQPE